MGRTIKLIMVTGDENHNKYYNMFDNGSNFLVEYGRVGGGKQTMTYPIEQWDKQYKSKVKKGYQDITSLCAIETAEEKKVEISDDKIRNFINKLQGYAKATVSANYNVSVSAVTEKQIQEAQNIIDQLGQYNKLNALTSNLNKDLLHLYTVLPRRMKNVKDYLFSMSEFQKKEELEAFQKLVSNEQDLLDTMRGQVVTYANTHTSSGEQQNILEAMGLEMYGVNDQETQKIKKMMADDARLFKQAYRVRNLATEKRFNSWVEKAKNKKTEQFWHGSRSQNWWNILGTGLLIRPSCAIYTASMYSDGIYAADKARKSIGYTSYRNSYWASGNDSLGYLAIFDFHLGNQCHIHRHDSSCYQINYKNLQTRAGGPYDSVFAHGGYDLRNNEYIVYTIDQANINYLVEFGD